MDRRNGWLPLALVALLAGGAIVPHLTPGTTSAGATQRTATPASSAPESTTGNAAFVDQLAQLLDIDIGEAALVREAKKLADGFPVGADLEIIRCAFDLELDRDTTGLKAATEAVARVWPRCGARPDRIEPLPPETLRLVRTAFASALDLAGARARDQRDEPVSRSIARAAASAGGSQKTFDRGVIDAVAAAARRRLAFLAVRRRAGTYFSAPDPQCGAEARRERVRFVIATVPDPVDSYARWQFDPTLMAITQAATASRYLPTRFYFPDTSAPPAAARTADAPLHERFPGVLLLRNDDPLQNGGRHEAHKLLVLLFAYETATSGVHAAALSSALRIVVDWHNNDPVRCVETPPEPILMLAPTFSGSSESIAAVLDTMRNDLKPHLTRIVSGSANAPRNVSVLNRDGVTFGATVHPNRALLDTLWTYLSETVDSGLSNSHSVAWLAESNTTYGNSAVLPGRSGVDHLVRYFPLHLSRIRSSEATVPAGALLPARFGPLKIDDGARNTDQLPLMSEDTTRSYQELTLAYTLRSMRDARIGFVGLVATDARDKMFLAREVLHAAPNVLLFTTESDILYSHPDFYSATEGMLLATPYPLESASPLGNGRGEVRRELPESTMVGVYNALLMLLNYDQQGRPLDKDAPSLLRYVKARCETPAGTAVDCLKPEVWISIVGREGPRPIWHGPPHVVYSSTEPAAVHEEINRYTIALPVKPGTAIQPEPRVAVGGSVRAVMLLATLLMVLQGLVAIYLADGSAATNTLGPYLLVGSLALVPIALLFAVFARMWLLETPIDPGVSVFIAPVAAGAAMLMASGSILQLSTLGGRLRDHRWALAPALAVTAMTSALVWFLIGQRPMADLFVDRMSQWFDGTSPGPPILALAIAIYAWPAIEFLRLWRGAPLGAAEKQYVTDLLGPRVAGVAQVECVNRPMVSLRGRPAWLAWAAAAALVIFGFDPVFRPLIVVDGAALGTYITIGFLTIEIAVVVALIQFVCLWERMADLLERAATAGYERTFRALPDKLFSTGAVPLMPRLHELSFGIALWRRFGADQRLSDRFTQELEVGPRALVTHTATWPAMLPLAGAAAQEVGKAQAVSGVVAGTLSVSAATGPMTSLPADVVETLAGGGKDHASSPAPSEREQFAVFPFVLIVRSMLVRMWDNLLFVGVAVALLAVCLWGYRLQMKAALVSLVWCDVIAAVAAVLYVFVRMERNEILSHMTSSQPGKIDWDSDFVVKLIVYGLIPLAGLFATQFPDLAGTLVHWLEPVQKALP